MQPRRTTALAVLFAYWRKREGERSGEVTATEIEEGNLQNMFILYTSWLSHTAFPKSWRVVDGLIVPPPNKEGPVEALGRVTLSKYVGRTISFFRRSFPCHPDFVQLDPNDQQAGPNWWKRLKPCFEKALDDFHRRFDNDFSSGATKILPLYYKNEYDAMSNVHRRETDNYDIVSHIDMELVLKKLMKEAMVGHSNEGPLQRRAWLTILYNAVGRPGEIKFNDTNNWMWHPRFEVVDILWQETKTSTSTLQAMAMVPNKMHYLICFYNSIGSFWAVEGGLFRTDSQASCATFLFPNLHCVKDNTVAKKIREAIQDHLPSVCSKEFVQSLTGESIRQATITEHMIATGLTYTDVTG
ncbi:hypothetical protein ACHAXR_003748 [Thalassiosira sp. AJA248-18]